MGPRQSEGRGILRLQRVIDDRPIENEMGIIQHQEGVDLLPSNIELSGLEISLFNVMSREFILKGYIDEIRKNYDYILIDCMPSLGMMTVNSLVAADSVIIPSQPNFLSTKGLNLLMHSISKVKRQINPRLSIDGILLTMVDNRTNNAKDIISSLRSSMGSNIRVFNTEIPHSVRAAECIKRKQNELDKLYRKKSNLIEMREDGDIDRDYFRERKEELDKQIDKLLADIDRLSPKVQEQSTEDFRPYHRTQRGWPLPERKSCCSSGRTAHR